MISAPERPTQLNTAELNFAEPGTQEMTFAEPCVRTHGHLALVNWAEPAVVKVPLKPQFLKKPVTRSAVDRWFERGLFLLMASSVAAIGMCFFH